MTRRKSEHVCEGDKCWTDDKKKVEVTCIGTIGETCTPDGKAGAKTQLAIYQEGQKKYESTAAKLDNLLSGYTSDDDEEEFMEIWGGLSPEEQADVAVKYKAKYGEDLETAVKDKSDMKEFKVEPTETEKAKATAAAPAKIEAKPTAPIATTAEAKASAAQQAVKAAQEDVKKAQLTLAQKTKVKDALTAEAEGAKRTKEAEIVELTAMTQRVKAAETAKVAAESAKINADVALEGAKARAQGAATAEKESADAAVVAAEKNVKEAYEMKTKADTELKQATTAKIGAEKKVTAATADVQAKAAQASAATTAEQAAQKKLKEVTAVAAAQATEVAQQDVKDAEKIAAKAQTDLELATVERKALSAKVEAELDPAKKVGLQKQLAEAITKEFDAGEQVKAADKTKSEAQSKLTQSGGTAPTAPQPVEIDTSKLKGLGVSADATKATANSITLKYDYNKNKKTTAADAVKAAVPEALMSSEYQVKVGGKEVVYVNGAYYDVGDMESGTVLKTGAKPVTMTKDTDITITKKPAAAAAPGGEAPAAAPAAAPPAEAPSETLVKLKAIEDKLKAQGDSPDYAAALSETITIRNTACAGNPSSSDCRPNQLVSKNPSGSFPRRSLRQVHGASRQLSSSL
ncbi:hypothetical protein HZC30_02885 [Candidatus Woesearchaeota archaeon]|nr:hypothetical protein [Candidatus Woesearchaeota archaeon]